MSDEPLPLDPEPHPEPPHDPEQQQHNSEAQRAALIAGAVDLCPWCDGRGQRIYSDGPVLRVHCAPCEGTGEADRWQGPAADDWRRRVEHEAHQARGAGHAVDCPVCVGGETR